MHFIKFAVLLLIIAVFFLSSCRRNAISNPAYTLRDNPIVERTKDADYKLYFENEGVWDVSMANSPDDIKWNKPATTFEGDFIEFPKAGTDGRMFFGVTSSKDNKRQLVSERIIPMEGAVNFRDIGGLPAGDNRIVRWMASSITGSQLQIKRALSMKE